MTITAEEAKELMDSTADYVLLDVREEDEFATGHIEGAILIPYESIEERAEEELPDKPVTMAIQEVADGKLSATIKEEYSY